VNKLLITGVGRSGTLWMSNVFRELGITSMHESSFTPFRNDLNLSGTVVETSWLAAPFLDKLPANTRIAVLVRHPDQVAESYLRIGFFSATNDWFPYRTGRKVASNFPSTLGRRIPPQRPDYHDFLKALDMPAVTSSDPWLCAYNHWLQWNLSIDALGRGLPILLTGRVAAAQVRGLLDWIGEPRSLDDIERALRDRGADRNRKVRLQRSVSDRRSRAALERRSDCLDLFERLSEVSGAV
jgi:hypothetical protein